MSKKSKNDTFLTYLYNGRNLEDGDIETVGAVSASALPSRTSRVRKSYTPPISPVHYLNCALSLLLRMHELAEDGPATKFYDPLG